MMYQISQAAMEHAVREIGSAIKGIYHAETLRAVYSFAGYAQGVVDTFHDLDYLTNSEWVSYCGKIDEVRLQVFIEIHEAKTAESYA